MVKLNPCSTKVINIVQNQLDYSYYFSIEISVLKLERYNMALHYFDNYFNQNCSSFVRRLNFRFS